VVDWPASKAGPRLGPSKMNFNIIFTFTLELPGFMLDLPG
jgi:hypothetical protein